MLAIDNVTAIKILLIMLSAPIWIPFAKELWREFNLAMREDGGLFGPMPHPRKRREIQAEIEQEPPAQIHIPKGHLGIRRRPVAPPKGRPQPGPQTGQGKKRRFGR